MVYKSLLTLSIVILWLAPLCAMEATKQLSVKHIIVDETGEVVVTQLNPFTRVGSITYHKEADEQNKQKVNAVIDCVTLERGFLNQGWDKILIALACKYLLESKTSYRIIKADMPDIMHSANREIFEPLGFLPSSHACMITLQPTTSNMCWNRCV